MKRKNYGRGISLIVLVITIIIVLILAGAVILGLIKDNQVKAAKKAVFLQAVDGYKSELAFWVSSEYMGTLGSLDISKVNATKDTGTYSKDGNILKLRDIITKIKVEHEDKFSIVEGNLKYIGNDEEEKLWLGITNEPEIIVPAAPENVDPTVLGYIFDTATNTITGYTGTATDLVIPKSFLISGVTYDVLKIGIDSFKNKGLTSLVISSNITKINGNAFRYNSTLTSVILDATNLKTDGSNSYYNPPFGGCNLANKLKITSNVTNIGDSLFKDAGITEVTIPNSVTAIEHNAFRNNSLTSISIPGSVTSIGNNVFDTNKITAVSIPSSVTSMGGYIYSHNLVTSFDIPSYMTTIPVGFLDNNKLTSITIPSQVTKIYGDAFNSNPTLNSLVIDATNLKTDGSNSYNNPPFGACNLTNRVTITSNVTNIGDSLFKDAGITEITIPNSVTAIEHNAFRSNKLTSISIPVSVTTIGNETFRYNNIPQGSAIIKNTQGNVSFGSSVFSNNGTGGTETITPVYEP